ncbi:MAG: hypothetical protein OXI82_01085 [Nitrospinae bacterium]|nr:hypothetical protein [Nitrospinota bacterium]
MKVRECFLQAVAIVGMEEDAREAWAAMNRINAPWAAVFDHERLVGIVNKKDLDEFIRVPEVFQRMGEVAKTDMPSRRGVSLSPNADLSEAVFQLEMAGADAAFVEGDGRPPGILETSAANRALSCSS